MRNTYKYTKMYSGGEPQFVEGDVFRITIPLSEVATATVGPLSSSSSTEVINEVINGAINGAINLTDNERNILSAISKNPHITKSLLISTLGISKGTVDRAIKTLKEKRLLERIGSNKTGYWKVIVK